MRQKSTERLDKNFQQSVEVNCSASSRQNHTNDEKPGKGARERAILFITI